MSNSTVTVIFGINSTSSAISIALRVLLIPNSTGYPCYHSLIVGQLFKKSFAIVATLYRSLNFRISFLWNFIFNIWLLLICLNIPSDMGRASVVKNDIVFN